MIVVTHAGAHHLDDSLESLSSYADSSDVEVVLVDNGSADRCGEAATRRWPSVKSIRSESNLGFAGGVHLGVEAATGEVLVLLNDDAAASGGFVEAHIEALAANPQAAASAGRLVSWDGSRHDFIRGGVTFDCHAFQLGQGFPVDEVEAPAMAEPVPFACGGNMAIRREDWVSTGGFDPELFAYFEDVDLGWRLWAVGREVVATPEAVARHRGAATSATLGDYRRGVLFERNALRTFFSCADDEYLNAFGTAVFATFLRRIAAFSQDNAEMAPRLADPFGEQGVAATRRERWSRRLRDRGVIGSARHLLARLILGPRVGAPTLEDGHLLMQLQASQGFFSGIDRTGKRRAALNAERTVPDREIVARFPRFIVPTYPGDEEWFASDAFRDMLPGGWPLEHRTIDEI
ncbi:MAG: glycosyltransferase family 2 protein, partial [Thermoanaerobaculales bacterium]|nr:glycosyltransferase family 2 protein [Thermoanaerobaculales bacterium]